MKMRRGSWVALLVICAAAFAACVNLCWCCGGERPEVEDMERLFKDRDALAQQVNFQKFNESTEKDKRDAILAHIIVRCQETQDDATRELCRGVVAYLVRNGEQVAWTKELKDAIVELASNPSEDLRCTALNILYQRDPDRAKVFAALGLYDKSERIRALALVQVVKNDPDAQVILEQYVASSVLSGGKVEEGLLSIESAREWLKSRKDSRVKQTKESHAP